MLVVEGAARQIKDDPVGDTPPWWVAALRIHDSAGMAIPGRQAGWQSRSRRPGGW
jgi:hypothetical protein